MRPSLLLLALAGPALGQGIPRDFVRAPELDLPADGGGTVRLADLRGSIVVLYFFRHG